LQQSTAGSSTALAAGQCAFELGVLAAGLRAAPFAFFPFVCAKIITWGMENDNLY